MPFTMLKPSDHTVTVVVPSIVAVMPVAEVPPTALLACMPLPNGAGVAEETVHAVEFRLSWARVWFVVVTVDWLTQARVNSAAAVAGTFGCELTATTPGGVTAQTPVGVVVEPETHVLTVKLVDRAGKPAQDSLNQVWFTAP